MPEKRSKPNLQRRGRFHDEITSMLSSRPAEPRDKAVGQDDARMEARRRSGG
jgi:hypothetical protein